MIQKLAAMMTIMAMAVFIATWLFRKLSGLGVLPLDEFFGYALLIFFAFMAVIGPFMAQLGISLVQEVIAERRALEEERRLRARALYHQALSGDEEALTAAMGGGDGEVADEPETGEAA